MNGYDRNHVFFTNRLGDDNNYLFDSGNLRGAINNHYATTEESWVTTGDEFITLKMSNVNGMYQVKMNDKIIHEVVDPIPKEFSNVQATLGNTYGIHNAVP